MYQVGDLIIYGGEGVCRVEAVGPSPVRGSNPGRLYYTLAPMYRSGLIYAPTDVRVPMRPILTEGEARELIRGIPEMNSSFEASGNSREAALQYKNLLQTYEERNLLCLIRSIYCKNQRAIAQGKGYGRTEEHYLKRAQELLHGELAVSLNIPVEQVEETIARTLESQAER